MSGPGAPPVSAVCLVILDGWGLAEPGPGNAVEQALTPVFDELWESHAHTQLTACGKAVGLPDGQMGNSEVGHLNLGAGAVVMQDLTRIDDAVEDGSFAANEVLVEAVRDGARLHLLGLVSHGGVHASMKHLRGLLELASEQRAPDVVVHAFTDGRDTAPDSGAGCLAELEAWMAETGGRVGSVCGRYYAMDRDRRWDRTQFAYDAIVHGKAEHRAATGQQAVRDAYDRGETDEFVKPALVGEEATVRPGDCVVFFNFRPDRARQLTRALAEPGFDEVDRGGAAPVERLATLTEYQEGWPYPVAFTPSRPQVTLASVLSARGVEQLHVAETEKYAHVTYFFNGGEEHEHRGEERRLVDSPRDVPTYDHKPEMSVRAATATFVEGWREGSFGFGIINFANPDMVGHTGVIPAAVKGIEAVDECLGQVVEAVHEQGGACLITADHGNADEMLELDGSPDTAHSLNPVPVIVTAQVEGLREAGILADVAPTVLGLMGQEQPPEMTGTSLLAPNKT